MRFEELGIVLPYDLNSSGYVNSYFMVNLSHWEVSYFNYDICHHKDEGLGYLGNIVKYSNMNSVTINCTIDFNEE
jgi:hypothetical protein